MPVYEFGSVTDDRGQPYALQRYERLKGNDILYARFTPAPPAGATLTVTVERIYETTGQPWEATLTLP